MGYDTGIADRLRAAGIPVVEIDGWKSRGSSSFSPGGSVNHHTAGGANGATPSLNTCIYGRPDLAGPLCNVMQSREPDGNDKAYVIAAGRANHAGSGGWKGLSGNSSVYGLEIEHTGTVPLPMGRQQIAARIHAAMFGGDAGMVCQHFEWTSRKIDAAQGVDPNGFRQMVAEGGGRPPTPEPEEDFDMRYTMVKARPDEEPAGATFLLGNFHRIYVANKDEADSWIWYLTAAGGQIVTGPNNTAIEWPRWMIEVMKPLRPGYDDQYIGWSGDYVQKAG